MKPTESEPDVAVTAPKRGVFRAPFRVNGLVPYAISRCDGECMAMVMVHPDWIDENTEIRLGAMLDRHCPNDPVRCAVTCAGAPPNLKLV